MFIFFAKQDFSGQFWLEKFHCILLLATEKPVWNPKSRGARQRVGGLEPTKLKFQFTLVRHASSTWTLLGHSYPWVLWQLDIAPWVGSKRSFQVIKVFPHDWADHSLGRQSRMEQCSEARAWASAVSYLAIRNQMLSVQTCTHTLYTF